MTEENGFSEDKHGLKIDYGHKPRRFSICDPSDFDRGIEHLSEEGYAVFTDLMNDDEVQQHRHRLWEFLECIPNLHIDRNDPETWHQWFVLRVDPSPPSVHLLLGLEKVRTA